MTAELPVSQKWWTLSRGDIDTTIANVGFNLAQMLIPVFLLLPVGIPIGFSVTHMVPGYALGYLVGSLGFVQLAVALSRKEKRTNVTAHVYGNNVPAIIAYTLSIMLPVYLQTRDMNRAWQIGAAAVAWTGIIKLLAAPFAGAIRRFIPAPATMTVFGAAMYSYLAMVLLQRVFDSPIVGLIALAIVAVSVLGNTPFTEKRIPPFLVAWLVPLAVGLAIGYVHPVLQGITPSLPLAWMPEPLAAMGWALPYLSVIAPMAIYHVLQDIASVAGGTAVGDDYDARAVLAWDGLGTLVCGLAGSTVAPVVYAMLPPYKAMGARIGFALWTPIAIMLMVLTGLSMFMAQLFPWPILAAMIAYVSVGVGGATLRRVEAKYHPVVLLGFVLPVGAVVTAAMNSALPALQLSAANPQVQAGLNRAIYWNSLQGLGNGFLFLVLVVASMISETLDRRFERAAFWCVIAAVFAWFGLMHSAVIRWGAQPQYAIGWMGAAIVCFTAKWWGGAPIIHQHPPSPGTKY